jgi:hypothetical protein
MSKPPPLVDSKVLRNYLIAQKVLDQVNRAYPWYDAAWLKNYVAAKKTIAVVRPGALAQFVNAFVRLRTRADFAVRKLDRVFDDAIMREIRQVISSLPINSLESHELEKFGRQVVHDHPAFIDLQKTVQPLVSELVKEAVEPSYNFLSMYSRFGICQPHLDSPLAKWTLDVCIDQTDVWPIHFSQVVPWPEDFNFQGGDWQDYLKQSSNLRFRAYGLKPNEAVLFSGSSQWHYRDGLLELGNGRFCTLLFFHFLPEGMADLICPKTWPEIFGIPELEAIVGGHL